MIVDLESIIEDLYKSHPDKMLLDECSDFQRGKLAGHIEVILELEAMLKGEEEDNGDT